MNNRIAEQFRGFIATFPLWEGSGPFEIEQFQLPSFIPLLPQKEEILNENPSLSQNFVLGKRMESFFSWVIKNSSEYLMVAENLQIIEDKITIGEIDFLLKEKITEDKLHVEMVYKFYLYDPAIENEVDKWIGPNRKDSLPQKIKKLKDKQFPLLYRKETTLVLRSLRMNEKEIKQQVSFKAHLFVPRAMMHKSFPLVNNSCISGYWIPLNEFTSKEYPGNLFFAPKKPDWPITPADHEEWVSFSIIYEQIIELHKNNISPLVWMKNSPGIYLRFFVVWW